MIPLLLVIFVNNNIFPFIVTLSPLYICNACNLYLVVFHEVIIKRLLAIIYLLYYDIDCTMFCLSPLLSTVNIMYIYFFSHYVMLPCIIRTLTGFWYNTITAKLLSFLVQRLKHKLSQPIAICLF